MYSRQWVYSPRITAAPVLTRLLCLASHWKADTVVFEQSLVVGTLEASDPRQLIDHHGRPHAAFCIRLCHSFASQRLVSPPCCLITDLLDRTLVLFTGVTGIVLLAAQVTCCRRLAKVEQGIQMRPTALAST